MENKSSKLTIKLESCDSALRDLFFDTQDSPVTLKDRDLLLSIAAWATSAAQVVETELEDQDGFDKLLNDLHLRELAEAEAHEREVLEAFRGMGWI